MKIVLAVIVGYIIFFIGWSIIVLILAVIAALASAAREGLGLIHILNVLLMLILGPGVGAFFGVFVPSQIFRSVDPHTIFVSFVSITVLLFAALFVLGIYLFKVNVGGLGQPIMLLIQAGATVVGAKIGGALGAEDRVL